MSYLSTLISAKLFLLLAMSPTHELAKNSIVQGRAMPPIMKVTYSTNAGRGGTSVNLTITQNTLVYTQGHNGAEKTIKERTARSLWMSLTRSINIKDLDRIKSNPGHGLYDGTDITITVERGKEVHSIVNGNEDSANYKRIKQFTDILEGQLNRLEKRIHW